MILAWHKFVH